MDTDTRTDHLRNDDNDDDEENRADDIDMQGGNRESSDEESDVEDDMDQELRVNAPTTPKVRCGRRQCPPHMNVHLEATLRRITTP